MRVAVLSGGAAQGLVDALASDFKARTGAEIDATFGAVGGMKERLLAGTPADLLILTQALVEELVGSGHIVPGSERHIGIVHTAIAARTGDELPIVDDAKLLKDALAGADEIYFPDPSLATAGIHFAKTLMVLGIDRTVDARLKPHPNGASAMRALAASKANRPIGWTQATEIIHTSGVTLVRVLPDPFQLSTVYTAAIAAQSRNVDLAGRLIEALTERASASVRQRLGFAP
jgi:molybdate transport system substrate-binding protein